MALFEDEVAMRVPDMLRSMCKIWITLYLFGLFTISNYPHPYDEAPIEETEVDLVERQAERDAPITKILRTDKFIYLYLIAASHKFQGDYIVNSFK